MYSTAYLETIFGYFEQPRVKQRYGAQGKATAVWDLLQQNQFIKQEGSFEDIETIALLVDSEGTPKARAAVEHAKGRKALEVIRQKYLGVVEAEQADIQEKIQKGWAFNYSLCTAASPEKLIAQVNKALATGIYQPLGGVSVAVREDPTIEVLWSQALVQIKV